MSDPDRRVLKHPRPETLPSELLQAIFTHAAAGPSGPQRPQFVPPVPAFKPEWRHGPPKSLGLAAPFALVCRSWRAAAQALVFSIVTLQQPERVARYLAIIESVTEVDRQLAALANHVVLQLPTDLVLAAAATENDDNEYSRATRDVVKCLELCGKATHVHVGHVHSRWRRRLLALLACSERKLVALTLGSPESLPQHVPDRLWEVDEVLRLLPSLEIFRLTGAVDLFVSPEGENDPPRHYALRQLRLRQFTAHQRLPAGLLSAIMSQAPALQRLDVYFEALPTRVDELVRGFQTARQSLEHIRYIHNPSGSDSRHSRSGSDRSGASSNGHVQSSPPRSRALFDIVLPTLHNLRTLIVTGTDLSPDILPFLPISLRYLEVRNLSDESRFSASGLLRTLRLYQASPGSESGAEFPWRLKHLIVVDDPDEWEPEQVAEIGLRLAEVGVAFELQYDFEHEGFSDGSSI